jgi:hypothetical protein
MMLYDENEAKLVRNNSERLSRCEEEQWLVGTLTLTITPGLLTQIGTRVTHIRSVRKYMMVV